MTGLFRLFGDDGSVRNGARAILVLGGIAIYLLICVAFQQRSHQTFRWQRQFLVFEQHDGRIEVDAVIENTEWRKRAINAATITLICNMNSRNLRMPLMQNMFFSENLEVHVDFDSVSQGNPVFCNTVRKTADAIIGSMRTKSRAYPHSYHLKNGQYVDVFSVVGNVVGALASVVMVLCFPGACAWMRTIRRRRLQWFGLCHQCGYRVDGMATSVCPECGTVLYIEE